MFECRLARVAWTWTGRWRRRRAARRGTPHGPGGAGRHPAGRSAALAEVKVRGSSGAAWLPHGCGVAAAAAELLRGGGGVAARAGRRPGPRPVAVHRGAAATETAGARGRGRCRGRVGAEHVRLIRQTMRRIPDTVDQPTRDQAEHDLVEHARALDPDQLKHACARLLMCLDPDGSLGSTDEERQRQRARSASAGRIGTACTRSPASSTPKPARCSGRRSNRSPRPSTPRRNATCGRCRSGCTTPSATPPN